jgi:hypothetical protein
MPLNTSVQFMEHISTSGQVSCYPLTSTSVQFMEHITPSYCPSFSPLNTQMINLLHTLPLPTLLLQPLPLRLQTMLLRIRRTIGLSLAAGCGVRYT